MPRARVLVIDPDPQLAELLAHSLGRAGMSTLTACDAAAALGLFQSAQPDLVVLGLDIGMPAGLELLQTVCAQAQVILLGSGRREEQVVRGLDMGADDYLVKPFSFAELLARIRARLRRAGMQPITPPSTSPALRAGDLILDRAQGIVTYAAGWWCRRARCWRPSGAASIPSGRRWCVSPCTASSTNYTTWASAICWAPCMVWASSSAPSTIREV